MATVQEQPRSAPRHESFVDTELARARRRIRAQDVGVATLGLVAGTLAYALGMVLLDRWLDLPVLARQFSLIAYLIGAAVYVGLILLRPYRREVNPYFAARQVERAVPGAKNSVISWLDLRDEPLPPSIRAAVGLKAATDLKRADLIEVTRDGRLPWLGSIAGGLFVAAFILLFLLRPTQFLSLLGRALAPFHSAAIATQTELTLLSPAEGNVTVPIRTSVEIRVLVNGRIPNVGTADAVRLRFRYNPADPVWEELPFAATARDPREFTVRLSPNQVQNGFVYQIVGGDAATAQYRVQVRSSPLIDGFDVVYHYRTYLRFRDQSTRQPNLEAIRGTEVTLTAQTNRVVQSGTLTIQPLPNGEQAQAPQVISAERVPGEPSALLFRFVMEQDGQYSITFQTAEGERNQDPKPYGIKVLNDFAPQVDVTRPAADTLPINGTLQLEGKASDDFGITKMRLCLQVKENAEATTATRLADKPYRADKSFQFDDGTYPRALDYVDFQDLTALKTPLGVAVEAKPGMVIEYWLEAEDNCDYPDPLKANVGKSKVYRTTLAALQSEQEKKEQEQGAANDKKNHEQQQDRDHAKENEGKKPQQPQDGANQNPQEQPQQDDPQSKSGDQPQDQNLEKQARDIADKMNQQKRDKEKGEGKGEGQQQPADATNPGEPKGEPKDDKNPQPSAEPKAEQKGDPKSGQQPQGGDAPKGEGKNEGKPEQAPEPGEGKPQQGNAGQQGAQGANADPTQTPTNPGEPKPQPQNQSNQQNPSETKSPPQAGDQPGSQKPSDNPNVGSSDQGSGNRGQAGSNNQTPNQNPNNRGSDKADSGSRPPDQQQKSNPTPRTENSQGQKSDNRNASGDKTGSGPQQDPNNKEPKGAPDSKNKSKDGRGGKTGSGNPGDKPPPDANADKAANQPSQGSQPEPPGQAKERGASQSSPNKGEAKPTASEPDTGDPGQNDPGAAKTDPSTKGELKDAPKNNPAGGPPQAEPKTAGTPSEDKVQGDAKPDKPTPGGDPGRGNEPDGGKSEVKLDQKPYDGQGRKPTADEIAKMAENFPKLAEQLKNADPKAVRDAVEKLAEMQKSGSDVPSPPRGNNPADDKALENLRKELSDPKVRQAIEDALKKSGDATGQKPQTSDRGTSDAQPKSQRGESAAKADAGRGQEAGRGDPVAKGQSNDRSGQPQRGQPGTDDAKAQPKAGAQDKSGQPGQTPGQPNATSPNAGNSGSGAPTARQHVPDPNDPANTPAEFGPPPNANHAAKSGDLQLEKFPKNPDSDLLKELKMSEDEYKQFLQRLADYEKRRQAAQAADNSNLQRGTGRGASAANSGARRVETGDAKTGDINRGGASLAPPEYRDGYKGFTQDVSKTAGPPKKDGK